MLLVLAGGYVGLYALSSGPGYPLDDSWIHQAYGRNLGLRGEWALIPGEPSAASTAPLYTVLLAVGYALRVPPVLWTHLLGVMALWGTAVLGARLASWMLPRAQWAGLLAGFLLASNWHLIWAGAAGMETALFAMWTLLLPLLIWDMPVTLSGQGALLRGVAFGVLTALATLTRPEGAGLAALCALVVVVMYRHDWRVWVLWGIGAALGFSVFIAPYIALNWTLAGGFLPNTSAAKQVQHAPLLALGYPRRVWMMFFPLLAGGQVLLLPGVAAYIWWAVQRNRDNLARALLLLGWLLLLIGVYAARLPAAYQHGRYVIPAIPVWVVAGVVGGVWLVQVGRRSLIGRVLSRGLFAAALLLSLVLAIFVGRGIYVRDVQIINEEMVQSALWIRENLPEDDLLAIHDVGAVAYFAPRPLLDIAGLVSPEVIPLINNADALWQYIEDAGAVYLLAFPDQIPGDDPNDARLCPVFDTKGQAAIAAGGANMIVYYLAWDRRCPDT